MKYLMIALLSTLGSGAALAADSQCPILNGTYNNTNNAPNLEPVIKLITDNSSGVYLYHINDQVIAADGKIIGNEKVNTVARCSVDALEISMMNSFEQTSLKIENVDANTIRLTVHDKTINHITEIPEIIALFSK